MLDVHYQCKAKVHGIRQGVLEGTYILKPRQANSNPAADRNFVMNQQCSNLGKSRCGFGEWVDLLD